MELLVDLGPLFVESLLHRFSVMVLSSLLAVKVVVSLQLIEELAPERFKHSSDFVGPLLVELNALVDRNDLRWNYRRLLVSLGFVDQLAQDLLLILE